MCQTTLELRFQIIAIGSKVKWTYYIEEIVPISFDFNVLFNGVYACFIGQMSVVKYRPIPSETEKGKVAVGLHRKDIYRAEGRNGRTPKTLYG